jgi:hypothetical protein
VGNTSDVYVSMQAQQSGGVPGFPLEAVAVGVLIGTIWVWLRKRMG